VFFKTLDFEAMAREVEGPAREGRGLILLTVEDKHFVTSRSFLSCGLLPLTGLGREEKEDEDEDPVGSVSESEPSMTMISDVMSFRFSLDDDAMGAHAEEEEEDALD